MDDRVEFTGVSAEEMLALTGATYRQIDHWTRGDILRPTRRSEGSGHPRRWSAEDVGVARCITALTRLGIDLQVAARIARQRPSTGRPTRVRLSPYVEIVVQPGAWGDTPAG